MRLSQILMEDLLVQEATMEGLEALRKIKDMEEGTELILQKIIILGMAVVKTVITKYYNI